MPTGPIGHFLSTDGSRAFVNAGFWQLGQLIQLNWHQLPGWKFNSGWHSPCPLTSAIAVNTMLCNRAPVIYNTVINFKKLNFYGYPPSKCINIVE